MVAIGNQLRREDAVVRMMRRAELLGRLGKHRVSGGGRLCINRLPEVDDKVLQQFIDAAGSRGGIHGRIRV